VHSLAELHTVRAEFGVSGCVANDGAHPGYGCMIHRLIVGLHPVVVTYGPALVVAHVTEYFEYFAFRFDRVCARWRSDALFLVVVENFLARVHVRTILCVKFLLSFQIRNAIPACVPRDVCLLAAIDVFASAVAPNGPVVVAVATFAVVLEASPGVGGRSDLVEVVRGRGAHRSATAVVQVVLAGVGGAATLPGLDFNVPSRSLALPEAVVEFVRSVRDLDPFLAAVDTESGSDGVGLRRCRECLAKLNTIRAEFCVSAGVANIGCHPFYRGVIHRLVIGLHIVAVADGPTCVLSHVAQHGEVFPIWVDFVSA